MQYIVLDFETADYSSDSACALALVRVAHGRIEDEFYSLIKPLGGNFTFSWLHGITREAVRDAPGFGELWPLVVNFIGNASYLVAHNAPFDRRVLRACCQSARLPAPDLPFLCTLKGMRRSSLRLTSNSLDNVCRQLGISLNHHQAQSDARAAANILLYLQNQGMEDWQLRLK